MIYNYTIKVYCTTCRKSNSKYKETFEVKATDIYDALNKFIKLYEGNIHNLSLQINITGNR